MYTEVVDVVYLNDYRLRLTFGDGAVKVVDLEAELWGEVFVPLLDKRLFEQVFIPEDGDTIEWPNGADFAPKFLYEIGVSALEPV